MKERVVPTKIYEKIRTQSLIVYAIHSIIRRKEVCTYERLVEECFTRFPKVFSLRSKPQWPDSLRLDRPLRTLRQRGLIIGSVKGDFKLTRFGEDLARETELVLTGKLQAVGMRGREPVGRGVDNRIIHDLIQSDAFRRFKRAPRDFEISETEFRSMLRCTLETPERVVKQNLEYYRKAAEMLGEEDVIQFLSKCEANVLGGR